MNPRIRLLAEQAGIQMFEDRAFGWSVIAGTDHNVQRFAELIVAECMKVVSDGKYSADECYRNTHRIAHNNARSETSSDIKKHFGVEP